VLAKFGTTLERQEQGARNNANGYLRELFQSERACMLRSNETNEVDHQAIQHFLTEGSVTGMDLVNRCSGNEWTVK